jgi:acyl carrier protein
MPDRMEIEHEVFRVLRTLVPRGTAIEVHDRLIEDLKFLSDDATAMALDLEKEFKVFIPRAEWANVATVEDTIRLLVKHTAVLEP